MKPIPLGRREQSLYQCEHVYLFASRLYYSQLYSWFYVSMIIINSGLLIGLGILHLADPVEFPTSIIALEVIVTSILTLEVLGRICSQGRVQFFSSWCNLLDCGVVLLCVVSSILFLSLPSSNDLEEAVATVLMVCRYGVHFIRVLMMLKLTKKQHSLRGRRRSMDVRFEKLKQSGSGFDDGGGGCSESGSSDDFGMMEMVALGGFDDFDDDFDSYSNRINIVLSTDVGEDNKGTSKFDQLYNKHIRNHSSNHDGKVISKNVEKKKEQEEEEENIDGTTPTTPYHD